MKRILSLVLILAMSLCLFAGCEQTPATTGAKGDGLADAATYLYAMYKDNDGSIVRRDFKRVTVVMIDNVKYEITWTADSSEVKIGDVENSQVTIDINEEPAEDITFKLTATIKDAAGKTETVTFTHYIEAPKASGTVFVKAPEVGTAYKFALEQNEIGKTLYFTGEMSGYYLAMSENPFDAVDVFVEDVEGGQRIYFMKGEVKTYVDIVPRGADNPGKVNVVLTEAPTAVYNWDAERKTYVAEVDGNTWYLGTYSTYNTISASLTKYIDNVEVIGASQFPAGFCTVNIAPSQVATPAVNTAYKFALIQNEIGQTLYFTGEMSGFYLAMSQNPAEGVNIFIEDVEGGQRIYFMKGEVKTYIDIVPRGADNPGKVNVILTEAPTAVYNWDAERKTYVAEVDGNTWYLGTYSTYNTISASLTKYIDNVEVIGATQFPAGPYIVDGFMEMQPDFSEPETPVDPEKPEDTTFGMITAPVAGTAYKLGLVHGGKGNAMMYFTGAAKPNYPWYMLSTANMAEAVDVFVEEVDGGLRLYFMASGVKTYLDMHKDGTHYSLRLTTEPAAVYTWNTEHNTFVTTVEDKECFIGTSGTYDTFSCNKMEYVDSSYVAHLYGEGGTTETPETPEEPENPGTSDVTLQNGMKVVIYIPSEGKALSSVANGYNLGGVDVTMADGTLTGYGATEVWTVIVNADGTYSFECNGQKFGMQAEYASVSMGAVNDAWEVIALGDGLYNLKNVARNTFLDWYQGKFSTYNSSSAATDPAFQIAFFVVE